MWIRTAERLPTDSEGEKFLVASGRRASVRFARRLDNAWVSHGYKVFGVFAWAKIPQVPTELIPEVIDDDA